MFDVEISENTIFTATYSSVSSTCIVYSPLVVDYGVSKKYTNLFNAMTMFTRADDGTLGYYQNTVSSTYQVYTSQVSISSNVAIDFELVECTSCPIQTARYATGSSTEYVNTTLTQTGKVHIEITSNGTYIYLDGTLVQSNTSQTNMGSVRLFFRVTSNNTANFKYKDLVVYKL